MSEGKQGVTMSVAFNLFNLKQELEIARGREYSWAEMARGAGLHRNTIDRIAANQTSRVDLDTLARLMSFFHTEGMPITPNDLLSVEVMKAEN